MDVWIENFPSFQDTPVVSTKETLQNDAEKERKQSFRIASWNILADVYAQPRSFPQTDIQALRWSGRFPLLKDRMDQMQADIWCLQEVDHLDEWEVELKTRGFEVLCKQRPGRKDGCVTAWRHNKFEMAHSVLVDFDDFVPASGTLARRFQKANVAVICVFKMKLQDSEQACNSDQSNRKMFIVANTHLYWNPEFKDVKLLQAHLLMQHVEKVQEYFSDGSGMLPLIVCGDMNSLPNEDVYRYFALGSVPPPIREHSYSKKFLCDCHLNKLCRWLRILGFDCTLENREEELQRTKEKNMIIFEKARNEGRILLMTSKWALQRKECPESFFIDPRKLEDSLLNLCRYYHLQPDPERFLTICVKCNTRVRLLTDEETNRMAASPEHSGHYMKFDPFSEEGLDLYFCSTCNQLYWFGSTESQSSYARAKHTADYLNKIISEGMLFDDQSQHCVEKSLPDPTLSLVSSLIIVQARFRKKGITLCEKRKKKKILLDQLLRGKTHTSTEENDFLCSKLQRKTNGSISMMKNDTKSEKLVNQKLDQNRKEGSPDSKSYLISWLVCIGKAHKGGLLSNTDRHSLKNLLFKNNMHVSAIHESVLSRANQSFFEIFASKISMPLEITAKLSPSEILPFQNSITEISCSYQNEDQFIKEIRGGKQHNQSLKSCWKYSSQSNPTLNPKYDEPFFTNATSKFNGTLDYIFLSPQWKVLSLMNLPFKAAVPCPFNADGRNEFFEERSLLDFSFPDLLWPSDHFCISCELSL